MVCSKTYSGKKLFYQNMILPQIEWHLKAIVGKNLDGLNGLERLIGLSGTLNTSLGELVALYNSKAHINYSDFCTMAFKKLYGQVKTALQQI